ncbi:DUF4239 domain-containing protein [Bradyrhizobium sp. 2S1]|uniref:bestrophin-like domain n=1 Tax=Bradyrhizobium sp. 2S1 TaxID=1404429 RepID=UPI001CD084BE|nr:DUF4239 domain-containing protein [Bradyrhizobium sp. 2S1]MCK7671575.1 DUF4239 domain-containing protein [Bradyrhizobium sp. 2S1]
MAFIVFGFTYLLAILVFAGVAILSTKARAPSFKSISPGMLPVLGIIFGLFVAFTAAQVWNDSDRATAAVSREASSLRAVILLAGGLPPEQEARLRDLVRDYVEETVAVEWPMMARQTASLKAAPPALTAALRLVVSMPAQSPGQQTTQHEIITALNSALDARRQRIIVSQSEATRSSGGASTFRPSASCWSLPLFTATIGWDRPSRWDCSRRGWPHRLC